MTDGNVAGLRAQLDAVYQQLGEIESAIGVVNDRTDGALHLAGVAADGSGKDEAGAVLASLAQVKQHAEETLGLCAVVRDNIDTWAGSL